jgi:hypothetical protein
MLSLPVLRFSGMYDPFGLLLHGIYLEIPSEANYDGLIYRNDAADLRFRMHSDRHLHDSSILPIRHIMLSLRLPQILRR